MGGVSFAKAIRDERQDLGVPGPGAYKVPVKVLDVPRYLIPNQNEEFKFVWMDYIEKLNNFINI